MAKALAAKQQYKVKLLANEKSDDTEKDYVYYVGLVTKVEGDTLTVTMPPFSVPGPEEAAMMSALAMSNSLANFQNSVTMTKPESLEEEVAPNSVYVFVYLNNEEDETKTLEKMVFVTKQEPTPTPVIPIPVIPDISGLIGGQGSGAAAAVTTLDIRGKTGTSESTDHGSRVNYGWFTGYNAQADLPVAVTVLVENIPDGETGGTTAARIVKDIFTYIRNHPDRVQ